MDRIYEYEITAKSIFETWLIRTYLYRRIYNILYLLTKLLPIFTLITGKIDSTSQIIINIIIFFYFDIYILYRYFSLKKRVEIIYGDNKAAQVTMRQNEIEFKSRNSQSIISWEDISKVKETKWFFLVYKDNLVVATFYKRDMPENDLINVTEYFKEQSKDNKNIILK